MGSGAGGGPLATNLARAGFKVLLLEAGDDPGASPNYAVPAFHPLATEDPELKWDYFVRHYADNDRSNADPKFVPEEDGVLYPRAGTLGGCTAHHAMIMVYPHDSDWNYIAQLTGDESWAADNMRLYFQRLTCKQYKPWSRFLYRITGWNIGQHGYDGWLPVSMASPVQLLWSPRLLRLIARAALTAQGVIRPWLAGLLERVLHLFVTIRDLNAWAPSRPAQQGVRLFPVSIDNGRRFGVRELILSVKETFPDQLDIWLNCLVTKVLLEEQPDGRQMAVGVQYVRGNGLYAAAQNGNRGTNKPAERLEVRCSREVILCAGTFNTPQLLMLSGIGPKSELAQHGINLRLHRPGVGRNLQDRYEVCVISRMKQQFAILDGVTFKPPEPREQPDLTYRRWLRGKGPYATNGTLLSVVRRSDASCPDPDLICFGIPGAFRGYYPGYANEALDPASFTWAILKAHTENDGGTVTLASASPQDRPNINFHYFDEGTGDHHRDLDAVVAGIRFCRKMNAQCEDLIAKEELPGREVESDDQLAQFAKDHAWGHHASGTCAIGPVDQDQSVVDSRFRIIGADNLRIVDASVFPRIPGFFIALPIYMIAEKAADVIIADAADYDTWSATT